MKIYANAGKKRFLINRLARFAASDLVVVHVSATWGNAEEQVDLVLDSLEHGMPVIVLSRLPVTDFKDLPNYDRLSRHTGKKIVLDSVDQYAKLESAAIELLGWAE